MGKISFPIEDKSPRTIHEVHNMATEIEANISSFKEQSFVSEVKACEPKYTLDIPKRVPSLEKFIEETLEDFEQDISLQEVEEGGFDEGYEYHVEEQEFTHAFIEDKEDMVEEREPRDIKQNDEVSIYTPLSDEAIHEHILPTQEEEDEVSHFPFQDFVNTLFYDS